MPGSRVTLEFRTEQVVAIGFLIIMCGCSFLPDKIGPVSSRAQIGCADHIEEDVIIENIPYKTLSESDPAKGSLAGSNASAISLTSGQDNELRFFDGSRLSQESTNEEAPEEASKDEPLVKTPELIRLPAPTGNSKPGTSSKPVSLLQLQDVIDSVVVSYPLLEAAILSRSVADGELLATQGEFDLKLKGGGTSGPLGFYKTNRFGTGASQPLFSGGEIFGGYKIGRGNFQPWFGERETNDGGEFSVGIAIPLRQNRQIDARRAAIFRATYGRDAIDPHIQTQVLAFVWEASYAYWQWVAVGGNYQIAQSLLEIAQLRNDGLNKRVDLGDLPRIELTDNQRLIVSRQAALIDARRKLQQSAIKLSLFMRTPDGQPSIPTESHLPAAFPEAPWVDSKQMEGDIELAMANRPELVSLEFLRRQLDIDLAQARNLYLPAVDVVLLGSQDMGAAASPKRDKSPFELEASLQVSVPLQRRKARGKIQATEGKLQRLSAKIRFTQDKIATDVQQVYAALLAAYDRIAKAKESLKLARTMEQAERRKFDLGDSTLLLVNLREQATADTAKSVLQAMLDYYLAQADYQASMALRLNEEVAQ